jgi:hypothetical protein
MTVGTDFYNHAVAIVLHGESGNVFVVEIKGTTLFLNGNLLIIVLMLSLFSATASPALPQAANQDNT